MDTNRVRQFCVVAEIENLRKAAEILNISHTGLFKSLKVLEAELGFVLFEREGRGIILSDAGKAFYPKAQKFLHACSDLLSTEGVEAKGTRIGTFEVFSTYFFADLLSSELADYKISLRELIPGQLENSLLNDEIDIGITYEPIPTQGLDILKVGSCEMALYGRENCFKTMSIENIPFAAPIIPIDSVISGVKGLDGWPDHKIKRNIKYKVDMLETAMQLASRGKAIGFFPSFVVEIFNAMVIKKYQLKLLPTPKGLGKVKRNIYLLKRHSSKESIEMKKIAKALRQIFPK